ncbi:MAG TPA: urate hydroxylase PuuD [Gemmatimonadales bacterium]|nr:urate hydroxylase PuuD [Gemmatimonadales bacterium]
MSDLHEWLNLFLRWSHAIAGIMWIGQTYLFNWMEKAFDAPKDAAAKPNISGELWMVHGGGFYLVEKQKWPEIMPRTLHWFKWEAMFTWLTGFGLLISTYWLGAPLLDYGSSLPRWQGMLVSAGSLAAAVAAYRLVWKTPLGRSEALGFAALYLFAVAAGALLMRLLSDRAAYLHVGAMMGTVMVTNVWMTIIPNQKRIMAITEAGGPPRPELSLEAKRCSKHNTFMSMPLLFLMLSNHYPATTFGGPHALLVLAVILPLGAWFSHLIRENA